MVDDELRRLFTTTLFIAGKMEWWPNARPDDAPRATRVGHYIVPDLLEKTFPSGATVYIRLAVDGAPIDRARFLDLATLAMEGALDAYYSYSLGYSEYTPGELIENAKVGEHDLQDWITDYEDRYVAILVSDAPMPDLADSLERATDA